jgi:2-phospho-L-lactate guanylyltransferase
MHVVVPFDARDPNSRLAPALGPEERDAFATAMLEDVCTAVRAAGQTPTVLATAPVGGSEMPVRVADRPLSPAVNQVLAEQTPVAVVMADLPLVTADTIERLLAHDGEVVLAPGLGGGTNALVARHPEFRVDYHGGSYQTHCQLAAACGVDPETLDSFRLAVDIDTPADLGEVLLHGEGRAAAWLREAGFELDTSDGRARARREE